MDEGQVANDGHPAKADAATGTAAAAVDVLRMCAAPTSVSSACATWSPSPKKSTRATDVAGGAGLHRVGYSWAEIANRLCISRQAAQQRWSDKAVA